jgi:cystathionine beta-lyase/cystathionine gamma-synthase
MGLWSLLALVTTAFAASASAAMVATDCNPASVFKIQSLEVVSLPAPANTSLTMTFDVPSTIKDGSVLYSCTLNGMPVYSETLPLCTQTACPIESGRHVQSSSSESPSVAGTLLCTLKWHSLSNEDLLCVKMKYTPTRKIFRGHLPSFEITSSYVDFEPTLYGPIESNVSLIH